MSIYEEAFVGMMDAVDALLAQTDNPAHRAILKNYRRHVLLEVSGRYPQILAPDMMVGHPVYRLTEGPRTLVLDGKQAVRRWYRRLVDSGANVMWATDEQYAVADWGFAAEMTLHHVMPGAVLAAGGTDIDDLAATHLVKQTVAFHWPYENGLLIGEHVYQDTASTQIIKLAPPDVITPARAAELLAPVLAQDIP